MILNLYRISDFTHIMNSRMMTIQSMSTMNQIILLKFRFFMLKLALGVWDEV